MDTLLRHRPPRYNPVLFYGGQGTGKTHLAAGVAAAWRSARPTEAVVYVDAKSFHRQLAEVIRMKTTDDFCRRYRTARLLCVDNVQQLARHREAQRQLAMAIDALQASGGQVVLTACSHPAEITELSPALRSRIVAGLVVELPKPTAATRERILTRLASSCGLALQEETARLLAEQLDGPVPALARAVAELKRAATGEHTIGGSLAQQYLDRKGSGSALTVEQVARATARRFGVPLAALRGRSRSRSLVMARQIAIWLSWRLTRSSFRRLGQYFGGRDHTTISHSYCKAEATVSSEPAIQRLVEDIRQDLFGRLQSAREPGGDKKSVSRRHRVGRKQSSDKPVPGR